MPYLPELCLKLLWRGNDEISVELPFSGAFKYLQVLSKLMQRIHMSNFPFSMQQYRKVNTSISILLIQQELLSLFSHKPHALVSSSEQIGSKFSRYPFSVI